MKLAFAVTTESALLAHMLARHVVGACAAWSIFAWLVYDGYDSLSSRVVCAVQTPPTIASVIPPLLVQAVLLIPYGLWSGFMEAPSKRWRPDWSCCGLGVVTFFAPSLFEELLFRVLLLPTPCKGWSSAALAWASFVLYHVDCFHLPLHRDSRFLISAAVLGAACTYAFCASHSLWSAVLTHWVVVWLWLTVFGGRQKVEQYIPKRPATGPPLLL